MTAYHSNNQQTIFDVAIMHYGDVSGLEWLLNDNPALLDADGGFEQFGRDHLIRNDSKNAAVKAQMLKLIPASEGDTDAPDNQNWIGPDGMNWIDDTGQNWNT